MAFPNGSSSGSGSRSRSDPRRSAAAPPPAEERARLAQALEAVTQGEHTASRLEAELGTFEAKLDALLATFGLDGKTGSETDGVDEEIQRESTTTKAKGDNKPGAGRASSETEGTAKDKSGQADERRS